MLHHQLHDRPAPLCEIRPDVPAAFESVIMRALEKDPFARQASCSELVVELARARDEVARRNTQSLPVPVPSAFRQPDRSRDSVSDLLDTLPRPQPVPRIVALVLSGGPQDGGTAESLAKALPAMTVVVAQTAGAPVLEALRALTPACVVIDMDLQEESPDELCAQLRSAGTATPTPILVVGEELHPDKQLWLRRIGVSAILVKPVEVESIWLYIGSVNGWPPP